ncbi:hypothetical protein TcCL_NonESM06032, partial [Trypanosoma cruzi]
QPTHCAPPESGTVRVKGSGRRSERRQRGRRHQRTGGTGNTARARLAPVGRCASSSHRPHGPSYTCPKKWLTGTGRLRTPHSKRKRYTCIWFNFWSDMKTTSAPHNARSRRKPAAHQQFHPSSASRPPATPLHSAVCYKRTQAGGKRTAASPTSRGRVPLALSRPLGASAAGRASRHALSTHREPHHRHRRQVAPWDAPFTNKSHENTRIHPRRLPTAR